MVLGTHANNTRYGKVFITKNVGYGVKANNIILQLYRQWVLRFWLRNSLILVLSLILLFPWLQHLSLWVSSVALFGFAYFFLKDKPDRRRISSLLNHQFPELEFSSKLLENKALAGLAALQQHKVEQRLKVAIQSFKHPVKWSVLYIWVGAVVISWVIQVIPIEQQNTEILRGQSAGHIVSEKPVQEQVLIDLKTIDPVVRPPSYTGLKPFISDKDGKQGALSNKTTTTHTFNKFS